jgi:epsilon-lactone hydrolase
LVSYPAQRISLQAELLRLALRFIKNRRARRTVAIATVRRRLERIERFVPRPPAGTLTTAIDGSGVNAVRIAVAAARSDRCVLYFHGGAYTIGTARLLRDFTWRIGAAARACVLYFDYRLAPEHPFPAALEDAVTVYRWLAQEFDPRRIAFVGDSAGGGLALGTLYKLRDEGMALPAALVAVSPWTDLALTGPSLKLNAATDPMLNVAILPALANGYLGHADARKSLRLAALWRCDWAATHADPRWQRRNSARRRHPHGREIARGGMRGRDRSVAAHAARLAPLRARSAGGPPRHRAHRHLPAAAAVSARSRTLLSFKTVSRSCSLAGHPGHIA